MDIPKDYREGPLEKETATFNVATSPDYLETNEVVYGDTMNDVSDMQRLGKKQEFRGSDEVRSSHIVYHRTVVVNRLFESAVASTIG
ncbi:MAG: hypothetical protein Q9160_000584 [Pyrenula sp. 1 TL-2023]